MQDVLLLESQTWPHMHNAPDTTLQLWNKGGHVTVNIECNEEFQKPKDQVQDSLEVVMMHREREREVLGNDVNFSNAEDHVPAAEWNNRTMRDAYRVEFY